MTAPPIAAGAPDRCCRCDAAPSTEGGVLCGPCRDPLGARVRAEMIREHTEHAARRRTRTAIRGARLGVIAWLLWLAPGPWHALPAVDRGERYTEVEPPVRLGPMAVAG